MCLMRCQIFVVIKSQSADGIRRVTQFAVYKVILGCMVNRLLLLFRLRKTVDRYENQVEIANLHQQAMQFSLISQGTS